MSVQHIVKFQAENFMRLRAVEIIPNGSVIEIRGKNAQGKTSVINAIWAAFGGKDSIPDKPIRDGEEKAFIDIETEDYIVRRTFTQADSYLTVRSRDGGKISNPQQLLDGLVGKISFDPLEFTRKSIPEQVKLLADMTGVDLSAFNDRRKDLFSRRTEVNRTLRAAQQKVKDAPAVPEALLKSDPLPNEISLVELVQQRREAEAKFTEADSLARECEKVAADCDHIKDEIEQLEQRIKRLKDEFRATSDRLGEIRTKHQDAVAALPDMDAITEKERLSESYNQDIRNARVLLSLRAELETVKANADELTTAIEDVDRQKAQAIAAADLPVNGLTFNDDGVFYNAVPLAQCSSAEQLKISTALAIALNPNLRVIRISDGSLLDKDHMDVMRLIAENEDFQIWIERVEDPDAEGGYESGPGVIIEDGGVVAQ